MDIKLQKSSEQFFFEKINPTSYREETKAYIAKTLASPSDYDLSDEILTLEYAKAYESGNFDGFQKIGDWLLFAKIFAPEHLKNASENFYDALAQNSYYKCYRILHNKWLLFEELADMFPLITLYIRECIILDEKKTFLKQFRAFHI
jgi:hypothetical protein